MYKEVHSWDNLNEELSRYLSTIKEEILTVRSFWDCVDVWYSVPKDTIHQAIKCGYEPRCLEFYIDKDFTVVVHTFKQKTDESMNFVFVSKERK